MFSITEVRRVIEAVGASPSAIARELNCSTSTIYTYIRKYDEIKAAYEKAKGGEVEEKPQFPKEKFENAIKLSYGVKASVAAIVGCSRQTVDNAFGRWPDLVNQFDVAKSTLLGMATGAMVDDIMDKTSPGHQRAYMFVVKTQGKDEGFVERSELTGADGAALLDVSPDVLKQITDAGLNVAEVLKNFADMVKVGG